MGIPYLWFFCHFDTLRRIIVGMWINEWMWAIVMTYVYKIYIGMCSMNLYPFPALSHFSALAGSDINANGQEMHTSQKCVMTSEHNVGGSPKSPSPGVTKAQNLLVILTRAVSPLHFKRKSGF